jgi:AraC family transcriptional regulator
MRVPPLVPIRTADQLPHPILAPALLGPSTLLGSSAPLSWSGLLLEKYTCNPGERPEGNVIDRPVLVMVCSPTWRGECNTVNGTVASKNEAWGTLTVVPKGLLPAMRSTKECELLFCALDETFLAAVVDELEDRLPPSLGKRGGLHDHAVSEILNLLFAEVESGGRSGTLYAESLAHPTRSCRTTILPPRKLRGIQDLIESRLEADLTLQELAAEIGYSRSHFLRMFRATTGTTPHRYVLKRRVERARQLLEQAEPSIAEIAFSCGFSSQAHLTLAFRKQFGITPAEYRRHL